MVDPRTILENRAHEIVEAVVRGNRAEDDHWELKSQFPQPDHCYRQLAGHANAARGEPIFWLFGLDEDSRSFVDLSEADLAEWFPQVQRFFEDRVCPKPVYSRRFMHDGHGLVVVQFATDEAPYLSKVRIDSDVFEIAWREGTRTRSAKRREALRMLVPLAQLPKVELLSAKVGASDKPGEHRRYSLEAHVYLVVPVDSTCCIPNHRLSATLVAGAATFLANKNVRLLVSSRGDRTLASKLGEQMLLRGPATISIDVTWLTPVAPIFPDNLLITVRLHVVESDQDLVLSLNFPGPPIISKNADVSWTLRK